mgnify:CR=1
MNFYQEILALRMTKKIELLPVKLRATKMATDLPYYVEGYSYDASAVRWFTGTL